MFEIFFSDLLKYILPFFILISLIGAISLPLSNYIFNKNWDFGFANSQIIGLLGITWLSFISGIVFTQIKILKNFSIFIPSIILAVIIWALINFFVYKKIKNHERIIKFNRILISVFLTFSCLIFFYFLNSFNSLYSPTGSEHHMNIGIINSIIYSNKLPPTDLWSSGNNLNYYYFGHFIFVILSLVLNLNPVEDSMFLGATTPSIFLVAAIVLVISIINHQEKNLSRSKIFAAILITFLFICFLNPIKSLYALNEYYVGLKTIEEISRNYTFYSVRIITNAIAENLNYSFAFMSLHALNINLITGILTLNLLFDFIRSKSKISFWNKHLISIFTLIGFSGLINTWDLLGYFLITLISLGVYKQKEFFKDYKKNIKTLILLLCPTIIIIAPWFINFISPGGIPWIVTKVSNLIELFSFWGIYFLIYIILLLEFRKNPEKHNFSLFLSSISLLIIFSLEIIYFRDVLANGELFRANSYYKFSNLAILLFSISYSVFLTDFILESKRTFTKCLIITLIFLTFWLNYPIMLVKSSFNLKYSGIKNQNQVIENFSLELLSLINYLNENKRENLVIWEGTGERSYKKTNFVSVFTGIPTVFGYQDHQFTWRNSSDLVGDVFQRQKDTTEIFTGENKEIAKELINKYQVNYIIISKSEIETYKESLKVDKLINLGEIVFEEEETKLIKITR